MSVSRLSDDLRMIDLMQIKVPRHGAGVLRPAPNLSIASTIDPNLLPPHVAPPEQRRV
jgi:hypothetical protein